MKKVIRTSSLSGKKLKHSRILFMEEGELKVEVIQDGKIVPPEKRGPRGIGILNSSDRQFWNDFWKK